MASAQAVDAALARSVCESSMIIPRGEEHYTLRLDLLVKAACSYTP